ncbi:HAD superfamily hydrolase (TIGR01509 family) [Lachnospiraceae bacterium PF1-21]
MINAIVFDMDGLLFDSERIVKRSWDIAGEELNMGNLGEHIYQTIGLNVNGRRAYFAKALGSDFPFDDFADKTRLAFSEIANREGVPLKEGALELLQYGKEHGLKMAVASSSRRAYGENLLKSGGISDFFSVMVFGDMVKRAKPDPEIYQRACSLLKVEVSQAIALEDSPNGILSAYRAGLAPIMVPDLVEPSEEVRRLTEAVLPSLGEVKAYLAAEAARSSTR